MKLTIDAIYSSFMIEHDVGKTTPFRLTEYWYPLHEQPGNRQPIVLKNEYPTLEGLHKKIDELQGIETQQIYNGDAMTDEPNPKKEGV